MPTSAPSSHEPVKSAPRMPKNAPISIMPSSPMLITPLRSQTIPPSAPKISGVAKRSMAAASADQTKTSSRLPSPERVATTAPIAPRTPAAAAHPPSRRSSPRHATTPAPTAAAASSRDGTGVRSISGGRAMNQATAPSATPAHPA